MCVGVRVCVFDEGYLTIYLLYFPDASTTRASERLSLWESTKKTTKDDNGATLLL